MIVLDASALVEVVGHLPRSASIAARLRPLEFVHAPYLIDVEVASALRRQCSLGQLTPERGQRALIDLRNARMVRHAHAPYLDRIWELRENFTAYDACYLALTEALGATLLTRDAALASAPLRRGKVEVV